jgi:hypothetical protein
MPYFNQRRSRRSAGSAEFVWLLVVLAAGAATFWWAGHKIGLDLSSLTTVAAVLGIRDAQPLRYDPRTATQPATIHLAGATTDADQTADQSALGTAPYCQAGQTPAFSNALGVLKAQLGDTMGAPLECEHASTTLGDTVQQTTTGLAAYTKVTNTVTFTDGWHHWALRNDDLLSWEGTESSPPLGQQG